MPSERLWERERQLTAASDCMDSALAGHGRALFILGDAGLGKTALLEETRRRAEGRLAVVRARCDPMEALLPFGLMRQIVHALGGSDARWAPEAQDAAAAPLFRTLQWLTDEVSGPVLVTVDDMHWADPDSLAFLGFLVRRLTGTSIAVIGSMRAWPPGASDLARSLVNRGDAVLEHLAPLSEEAAGSALAHRHGKPLAAPVVSQAWRVSGGNPLLLGLAADSAGTHAMGLHEFGDVAIPVDKRSLVLERFSGLSDAGASWARAAAVLGLTFRPELVNELAALDDAGGEAAAAELWRSGLARDGADGTGEFVHPLFAQLLYDDLAPPTRARLHARAFTALAARRMDDAAAEHAARGDLAGDEWAIAVLTEAGRRALRAGAPAVAASRLEAAVQLSGDGVAIDVLTELGQALVEAGRLEQAAAALTRVLEMQPPVATQVHTLTLLSRAYFSLGDFARADSALQTAASLAEHDCPEAVVLPLCHHAATVFMIAGPAAALPIAARAMAFAAGGDRALRAQARSTWGMLALWAGDAAGLEACEAAGRSLLAGPPGGVTDDLRAGASGVLVPYAVTAALAGRFADAEAAYRTGLAEAERIGALNAVAALRISYAFLLARTRVGDGLAMAERLLGLSDLVPLAEPYARTVKSLALLEMGDDKQSAAESEQARAGATPFGIWQPLLWLDHVEGLRLLRGGRFAEASSVYAELENREAALGVAEPCAVPYARHAIVAHVRAGRIRHAERAIERLEERADHLKCQWLDAAAAAGRAVLAVREERPEDADKLYRVALEHLEGASLPLEQAEVLIEHGTMLRLGGRPVEARDSFRRAGAVAEAAGAMWLRRRAAEELAAAGGRRVPRRSPHELTPAEQRVSRLAATGASDKDIAAQLAVSVRTVRSHLERVYAKLGIHSRRDLMTHSVGSKSP